MKNPLPTKEKIREMLVELFENPLTTARERQVLDSWFSNRNLSISEIRKIEEIYKLMATLPEDTKRKKAKIELPDHWTAPMLKRIISLVADPSLTTSDVDHAMIEEFPELKLDGWVVGTTAKKIKKYADLASAFGSALWPELTGKE